MQNQPIAFPNPFSKFGFDLSHVQHLHSQKGKIRHAQTIPINTKNTLAMIAKHECSVAQQQSLNPAVHEDFQRELRNISREVDNYIETAHKLLGISDDIMSMVSS